MNYLLNLEQEMNDLESDLDLAVDFLKTNCNLQFKGIVDNSNIVMVSEKNVELEFKLSFLKGEIELYLYKVTSEEKEYVIPYKLIKFPIYKDDFFDNVFGKKFFELSYIDLVSKLEEKINYITNSYKEKLENALQITNKLETKNIVILTTEYIEIAFNFHLMEITFNLKEEYSYVEGYLHDDFFTELKIDLVNPEPTLEAYIDNYISAEKLIILLSKEEKSEDEISGLINILKNNMTKSNIDEKSAYKFSSLNMDCHIKLTYENKSEYWHSKDSVIIISFSNYTEGYDIHHYINGKLQEVKILKDFSALLQFI